MRKYIFLIVVFNHSNQLFAIMVSRLIWKAFMKLYILLGNKIIG